VTIPKPVSAATLVPSGSAAPSVLLAAPGTPVAPGPGSEAPVTIPKAVSAAALVPSGSAVQRPPAADAPEIR
jgi:hypothetical protein